MYDNENKWFWSSTNFKQVLWIMLKWFITKTTKQKLVTIWTVKPNFKTTKQYSETLTEFLTANQLFNSSS